MKRTLRMLAAAFLLTAALSVSASAADFGPVAQELSAIGMFRGTGTSFELDRAPTRAEAAIMLVRLYGAEEQAKVAYAASAISHPFTDVPDYAAPHVAWLYSEGLTKGMSADTFGSALPCTDQSYATFLLRALGYQDGEDFDYAGALTAAQEKGFYTPLLFMGEFLRDDLAAMTYQALAADTAKGDTYLLDQLIEEGAVDKKAAAPMVEKMELYRELTSKAAGLEENAMDMELLMSMNMVMTSEGETAVSYATAAGTIQAIMDDEENPEMAYLLTTITDGVAANTGMWMKDGWVYQSVSDGSVTQAIKYPMDDMMAGFELPETKAAVSTNVSDLAALDAITKEKDGSSTVYTLTIREGLGGMMDSVMSLVGQTTGIAGMTLDVGEMTMGYALDRKGALKELAIQMPYGMTLSVPDETGAMVEVDAQVDLKMLVTIKALGDDVEIEYPDLSAFLEADPYAA